MKFYSEALDRLFDDEKELRIAEAKAKTDEEMRKKAEAKKQEEKAARKAEIFDYINKVNDLSKQRDKLIADFWHDYQEMILVSPKVDGQVFSDVWRSFFDI